MARSNTRTIHKHEHVTQDLRSRILSGALLPGDRLPSYAEMRALGVSQPTLDRVHVQLQQEGLIIREHGRGVFVAPARPRNGVVGFLGSSPTGDRSTYWAPLLQGIQDGAQDAGCEVLLLNPNTQPQWEKLDGLLVSHGFSALVARRPPALPFVSLIMRWEGSDNILSEDHAAAFALTEHLIQLGHTRIALISASDKDYSAQRYEGYCEALLAAGITPDSRWRHMLHLEDFEPRLGFQEATKRRMREWFKADWGELGCTAVMAYNDDSAYGVIAALEEVGLRVPQDVSVTGFDGAHTPPGLPILTTGKVDLAAIGRRGVERILGHQQAGGPPQIQVIPSTFRSGNTTATATAQPS